MNNENQPLMVTIRCITYNHEPYIRECLEGFVMQKTNFRFEAIVHDDASTDGTAAIIAEYAEKYPDIIKPLYETENQYSKRDGSLRRIMNAHMHGKYVAMCEGDDYWIDPLKLQKQVDFLETNPDYSMCFHSAKIECTDKSRIDKYNHLENIQQREYTPEDLINSYYAQTATLILKKDVITNLPSHQYFYYGDVVLITNCFKYGKVFGFNNQMSVYRVNINGVSRNINTEIRRKFNIGLKESFPEYSYIIDKLIVGFTVGSIKGYLKEGNFKQVILVCRESGRYVGYLELFKSLCCNIIKK